MARATLCVLNSGLRCYSRPYQPYESNDEVNHESRSAA